MQICDEQGHASLYEVVEAMLKEEKVMNIEVGYENPDSLAIAPYVKPSSPFTQPIVMLVNQLLLFLKYLLPTWRS